MTNKEKKMVKPDKNSRIFTLKGISITIVTLFIMLIVATSIAWFVIQHDNYNREIKPGDTYEIKGRKYVLPDQPTYRQGEGKVDKVSILSEEFLYKLRGLFQNAIWIFNDLNIDWWCSGGTLIGFVKMGTFLPWDDDIDVHVDYKHKKFLWSTDFVDKCAQYNIEVIKMVGATEKWTNKHTGAIRLRKKGTMTPVMDVFFETELPKDHEEYDPNKRKYVKIDSWYKDKLYYNNKEIWLYDDLFPIKTVQLDDMDVNLPNKAIELMKKQYGPKVMETLYIRNTMIAHEFAYKFLDLLWIRQKPSKSGKNR